MLGHYTEKETEELIYSTNARTRHILFPEASLSWFAMEVFGKPCKRFGGLLPNNCKALQAVLPKGTKLSDKDILRGSIYHILAPFLLPEEREKLQASIFTGNAIGLRRSFTNPELRYCLECARCDKRNGRPPYWRVLPNHPAVTCCDLHGIRLVNTRLHFHEELYDPKQYIALDVEQPSPATPVEIAVAADIRWLYGLESSTLPGFQRVALALQECFLKLPRYAAGQNLLRAPIVEDLLRRLGPAVAQVDPTLFATHREGGHVLPFSRRMPVQRYSLLGQLVGVRLEEVFALALKSARWSDTKPIINVDDKWSVVLSEAKRALEDLVARSPHSGRWEMRKLDPYSCDFVQKHGRDFYERVMPPKRRRKGWVNWVARDDALYAQAVSRSSALGRSVGTSKIEAAMKLGITAFIDDRRCPKTCAFLRELVKMGRTTARECGKKLTACKRALPFRTENEYVDWRANDERLHALILEAAARASKPISSSIPGVLIRLGFEASLLSGGGYSLLPKTHALIKAFAKDGRSYAAAPRSLTGPEELKLKAS